MNKKLFTGAAAVLCAAGAATATAGQLGTTSGFEAADVEQVSPRAQAYLEATQRELAESGTTVSTVALASTVEGQEIYLLKGPNNVCILIAGLNQPDGKSNELSCGNGESAKKPNSPLITRFFAQDRAEVVTVAVVPDVASTKVSASIRGSKADGSASKVSAAVSKNVAVVRSAPGAEVRLGWSDATGTAQGFTVPTLEQERALAARSQADAQGQLVTATR